MVIIKITALAFIALFIYIVLKDKKSEVATLLLISTGAIIVIAVLGELSEVISFINSIADKAKIDTLYIGIVLKILAIAYLTSFCSEICKDAGANTIATKVEFAGKIMILSLSIPILMAVLDSILQIL